MFVLNDSEIETLKNGLAKKVVKYDTACKLVKLWEKVLKAYSYDANIIINFAASKLNYGEMTVRAKNCLSGIWPVKLVGYNATMDKYDTIDVFLNPEFKFDKINTQDRDSIKHFADNDINGSVTVSTIRSYNTEATGVGLDIFQTAKRENIKLKAVKWENNKSEVFIPDASVKDAQVTKVFYGIELEVICRKNAPADIVNRIATDALNGFCIIKSDSSLKVNSSTGFEIVTVPATYDRHKEAWLRFFRGDFDTKTDKYKDNGVAKYLKSWVTGKCGIHIHISRKCFTKPHLAKFCAFFNNNISFVKDVSGRSSDEYAPFQPKYNYKHVMQNEYDGGLGRGAVHLRKPATVEIRAFRGNTREKGFFKCLEFVDAVFYYTQMCSWGYNKTSKQVNIGYEGFLEWLKVNPCDYSNLIDWLVEKEYIKGTRRKTLLKEDLNWSEQCA